MDLKAFPVIDLVATGNNIRRLRMERGLTIRALQSYFGFEESRSRVLCASSRNDWSLFW